MAGEIVIAAVLQGSGTALILAVVGQARKRESQTRAIALAELRLLQKSMCPHFLSNALNTIAALARVAPSKVHRAAGRLREFLRGSFAQEERALVPLKEELALVRIYLEIESLRFGERLSIDETIDPRLLQAGVPPFSFQPLVENAVQHGLRSSSGAGLLRISVRAIGPWLEMSVTDNGKGVPSTEIEQTFFGERQRLHALVLLRRRLQGLFGRSFQLQAQSAVGEGTTVVMRIPLKMGGVNSRSCLVLQHNRSITPGQPGGHPSVWDVMNIGSDKPNCIENIQS
jgi:two-component system sensor histidine kinase LytS